MVKSFWELLDWIGRFVLMFQMIRYAYRFATQEGLRDSDIDVIILGNLLYYWALLFRALNLRLPRLYFGKGCTFGGDFDAKGEFIWSLESM
jgi:hypothetical protein